jgi:hypothetical protein
MPPSDSNLGTVLLDMGVVTPNALNEAMADQTARLGEVLLSRNIISSHTLDYALRIQRALRDDDRMLAGFLIIEYQTGRMDRSLDRCTALVDEANRRVA